MPIVAEPQPTRIRSSRFPSTTGGCPACTSTVDLTGLSATDRLNAIMKAPVIRCDVAQWTLGGISLAGFNAIFSLGGAVAILLLMRKAR